MKFDDFDKEMRIYEESLDQYILPDLYIAARLDGRSFTRLTKEICRFEAPFDIRFRDLMIETVKALMDRVADYFIWRQEDSHRNSLNAHCYWALRKEGVSALKATSLLEGMSVPDKNELLFSKGINYNDLPNWQKRGVGVAFRDVVKEGFNPVKNEKVTTLRRELTADFDLPLGDDYRQYILNLLAAVSEAGSPL